MSDVLGHTSRTLTGAEPDRDTVAVHPPATSANHQMPYLLPLSWPNGARVITEFPSVRGAEPGTRTDRQTPCAYWPRYRSQRTSPPIPYYLVNRLASYPARMVPEMDLLGTWVNGEAHSTGVRKLRPNTAANKSPDRT